MFPLTLLNQPNTTRDLDERWLMDRARTLEQLLRGVSVEGEIRQIHQGPILTILEFEPAAGVPHSTVLGLADDLRSAMRAESLLIDSTPGRSAVSIQIPNTNPDVIFLRELLESAAYQDSTSRLTLPIGETIHGEPFVIDLAAMPHLLVGGATQSGKSLCLRAMISSILHRASPEDVRLILIDPGRLELGIYEGIPHLLTPLIVDPNSAANALRWAVREMEVRFNMLAAERVRNIEQYNRIGGLAEAKRLPFVVIVIDELATLMMMAGNQVEQSIARLAQMSRAVGIHLILATQHPSVNVLTGFIKANLPARISFRVGSKVDSRAVLDTNGAEQLLGNGDMLFLPPASMRWIRLHGPYVSEDECGRVASFLRNQGKPVFDESITSEDEQSGDGEADVEEDDLYLEAAWIVVSSGQASISYLQRSLRIGFSRAARLLDRMRAEGLL